MPIRASKIIVIYFVLGAVMFGGGAISYDDTGPTKYFVKMGPGGDVTPSNETSDNLQGVSGAITSLVESFAGPALLVWNLFAGLVSFIHWPIFVLLENGAPPRVTILGGGTLNVMFYMAVIRLVRASA